MVFTGFEELQFFVAEPVVGPAACLRIGDKSRRRGELSLSDGRSFAGFEGLLCEMSAVIYGQDITLSVADVVGIYPGSRINEAGFHDLDHAVASGIVSELQGRITIVKFDLLDLVAVVP